MAKRIYVGNLPFSASDDEVRSMFHEYGTVESCRLSAPSGRDKTRSAQVVMADDASAKKAVAGLRGRRLGGRSLEVR